MKRTAVCIALAILLAWIPAAVSAGEGEAQDLTAAVRYSFKERGLLSDHSAHTAHLFEANRTYTVSWGKDTAVVNMYLEFSGIPGAYTLQFCTRDGGPIAEVPGEQAYTALYALPEGTGKVKLTVGKKDIRPCSWEFWSAGTVPDATVFLPLPDKLEYMVVATHFDDDVLFLGAVVPICGAQQGRKGTIVWTASSSRRRLSEGFAGAREMGLVYQPLCTRFTDAAQPKLARNFTEQSLVNYLVNAFRRYKPEVVVTQDINGEYGHWQHKLTAAAVQRSVALAADESYDPAGSGQYGTWQVKKLYIHLYPENTLTLDVNAPIAALGGRSALETARDAFLCHASQVKTDHHSVRNEGVYDLSAFGLAFSAVGPDTPGVNDMFENIPPAAEAFQD